MTPKGNGVIRGRRDLLYDPKGHGDLCGQFVLVYDPKGQGVIRGQRDLLYDSKGQFDLWPWPKHQAFDPAGDHKCPGKSIMP